MRIFKYVSCLSTEAFVLLRVLKKHFSPQTKTKLHVLWNISWGTIGWTRRCLKFWTRKGEKWKLLSFGWCGSKINSEKLHSFLCFYSFFTKEPNRKQRIILCVFTPAEFYFLPAMFADPINISWAQLYERCSSSRDGTGVDTDPVSSPSTRRHGHNKLNNNAPLNATLPFNRTVAYFISKSNLRLI